MDIDMNTAMVATEAFLAQMRREWLRQNPNTECPVKTLEAYQGFHRGALVRSIQLAIVTAKAAPQGRA